MMLGTQILDLLLASLTLNIIMQTLGVHGHFDRYDHLPFDRLKIPDNIKGRITDYSSSLRVVKIETVLSIAWTNLLVINLIIWKQLSWDRKRSWVPSQYKSSKPRTLRRGINRNSFPLLIVFQLNWGVWHHIGCNKR